MKFVLLAAGKSKRLYKKIKKNKCLLKLGNKTLIENTILAAKEAKIKDISIVVGFKSEKIKLYLKKYNKIKYILNKKYNSREMLYSLILALNLLTILSLDKFFFYGMEQTFEGRMPRPPKGKNISIRDLLGLSSPHTFERNDQ